VRKDEIMAAEEKTSGSQDIPENTPENKEKAEGSRDKNGPLDGSTSGTIGGGGAETGGPTPHPKPPDMPHTNPDDAASGRMAPDPLRAANEPGDPLKPGASSVSRR